MAGNPPEARSGQRHAYIGWLIGLGLGYGVISATLYAFAVPQQIWLVTVLAMVLVAMGWSGWGFFLLAIALAVGINWTVDSGLSVPIELITTTLVAVIMAGTVGIIAAETRQQLCLRFTQPKWRPILLVVSSLGLGFGILVGLGLLVTTG